METDTGGTADGASSRRRRWERLTLTPRMGLGDKTLREFSGGKKESEVVPTCDSHFL